MSALTVERLRELFDYNPETGILLWKKTNSNVAKAGSVAGALCKKENRILVGVDGKRYRAHRIIYFMVVGEWPEEVDHINGNSSDNRWCNLRNVAHAENMRNRKVCSNNKTGIMGVAWNKLNSNWRARTKVMDKVIEHGSFDNFFDACCAKISALNKSGFHANHGRVAS